MKISRRVLTVFLLLGLVLSAGCASRMWSQEGTVTTVVLIRHAERTTVTKVLTDEGRARAAALPAAVADLDIVAIYSPDLVRNIDTVRPLAQHRGLQIMRVPAKPDVEQVTRRLLSDHPGKTVLWVGNTTNLDRIYPDLGGVGAPPVEYGDLYILRVPAEGDTKVIKRRFGN
jgi:hypothetical protein